MKDTIISLGSRFIAFVGLVALLEFTLTGLGLLLISARSGKIGISTSHYESFPVPTDRVSTSINGALEAAILYTSFVAAIVLSVLVVTWLARYPNS